MAWKRFFCGVLGAWGSLPPSREISTEKVEPEHGKCMLANIEKYCDRGSHRSTFSKTIFRKVILLTSMGGLLPEREGLRVRCKKHARAFLQRNKLLWREKLHCKKNCSATATKLPVFFASTFFVFYMFPFSYFPSKHCTSKTTSQNGRSL